MIDQLSNNNRNINNSFDPTTTYVPKTPYSPLPQFNIRFCFENTIYRTEYVSSGAWFASTMGESGPADHDNFYLIYYTLQRTGYAIYGVWFDKWLCQGTTRMGTGHILQTTEFILKWNEDEIITSQVAFWEDG